MSSRSRHSSDPFNITKAFLKKKKSLRREGRKKSLISLKPLSHPLRQRGGEGGFEARSRVLMAEAACVEIGDVFEVDLRDGVFSSGSLRTRGCSQLGGARSPTSMFSYDCLVFAALVSAPAC